MLFGNRGLGGRAGRFRWPRPSRRHLGQPEIQNLCVPALGDKNIGRLDVAMNNALRVRSVECVGNLDAQRQQRIEFHRTVADDMFQRRAVKKLHDDERFAVLLTDVVNGTNIRMVEGRRGPRLAAETFQRLAVLRNIFRKEFQSDKTIEPRVLGFVDNTHPAAAEFFDDAVMRDQLANHSSPTLG